MPPPNSFDNPPPPRRGGLGPFFLPPSPPAPPAPEPNPEPVRVDKFQPAPTLQLRFDTRNPIRSDPSRWMGTLGNVWDVLREDFVIKQLRVGGEGAQVFIPLGSAFGNLQTPFPHWDPDKKPDMMVLGQSEVILKALQPLMEWDEATLRENQARAKRGMVYFNSGQETPQGPVRFKIGVMDADLWRKGSHPYFDLRVSLLQADGPSFVYLGEAGDTPRSPSSIARGEFEPWLRKVQADYMRRSVESLLFRSGFSAGDLVERRYHNQFFNYELYRIFDWFKGKEQAKKYAEQIPQILAPAVRDYLKTHPNLLEVHHPDRGALAVEDISPENFLDLHFSWKQGFWQRVPHWWKSHLEFLQINSPMLDQTFRNVASNSSSRPGYNKVHWLPYGLRKFGRFFGVRSELGTRDYSLQASIFPSDEARLGRVENPLEQMIVLSGYGPKNETDEGVFKEEIVEYFEAEITKGLKPNLMLLGNNPSKFTFPVQGVPIISFALMEALRSPVVKNVLVVGVPDVGVVTEAFKQHFAEEIRQKGMTIDFQDVGLEGGSYAKNIQRGLDNRRDKTKMAILRPGDTPLVDPHNMAYHPWRHSADFIIGANGRNQVLDFMGMNPHLTQYVEGVPYDWKEGNGQGVLKHFIELVDQIYLNRKSVKAGAGKKLWIIGKFVADKLLRPQTLDSFLVDLPRAAWETGKNRLRKMMGHPAPSWAWDVDSLERGAEGHLNWKLNLRSTHLDPGSLIDVDGLRDYLLVDRLTQALPPKYLADLQEFSRTTLKPHVAELPGMTGTPKRINELFRRVYNEILEMEAKRPAEERLHIDADRLKRNGVDPGNLPFLETGEFNPEWVKIVLPQTELDRYIRAFRAYANRGEHAKALKQGFLERIELRREWVTTNDPEVPLEKSEDTRVVGEEGKSLGPGKKRALEQFLLFEIAKFPQNYQGLILEWDFDRVRDALLERAQKRFGEYSQKTDYLKDYFNLSIEKHHDTPLRRLLLGLKAAEAVRRYQTHLSPEEYRELFPLLEQHIQEASEVLATRNLLMLKSQGLGNFLLRRYFSIEQKNLDRVFIRKVGESPPPYRQRGVGRALPHSNGRQTLQRNSQGEIQSVETAVWLPKDIELFSRRLEILPGRIPDIIAKAAGVGTSSEGDKISKERLSFERTLAWVQTQDGQEYLKNNSHLHDTLGNRVVHYGPSLAAGMGSLLGAEYLADRFSPALGLDPVKNPHERFMFVVGASHLASTGVRNLHEVILNRAFGNSFQSVTTRTVQAGGETALAYRLHFSEGLGGALGTSLFRNYWQAGGAVKALRSGLWGLATLAPRASWNMGPGLMSAALTDYFISGGMLDLEQGSDLRKGIHFGSFFLPDAARIAMGNRIPILFRNPLTRAAGRGFALGFISDMAFSAGQRMEYGTEAATRKGMVHQMANELHDADRGNGLIDGALEMIAPQVAAWWDSVEFEGLTPKPNAYQRMAEKELNPLTI